MGKERFSGVGYRVDAGLAVGALERWVALAMAGVGFRSCDILVLVGGDRGCCGFGGGWRGFMF